MNFSTYELAIPSFIKSLQALSGILEKARAHAEAKKIDSTVLLQTRLIADQFPLSKQIQITCDTAKFFVSRLTDIEAPKHPDTEVSLDDFQERIKSTISFLQAVTPEKFNNCEDKTQSFHWNPGMYLDAKTYIIDYAIPNFYFHYTTAYSILRASGVDVGKADYIGEIAWHKG